MINVHTQPKQEHKTLYRYVSRAGALATLQTATLRYAPASSQEGQEDFPFVAGTPTEEELCRKLCDPDFQANMAEEAKYNPVLQIWLSALEGATPRTVRERCPHILQYMRTASAGMMQDPKAALYDRLDERFLMLCLTERKDNARMWNNYAEGYTSCVLEFEWMVDKSTRKVTYSDTLPAWHPAMCHDNGEHYMDIMFHKYSEFAWEEEWRNILPAEYFDLTAPELQQPGIYKYERLLPGDLTGVYFGKMPKEKNDTWLEEMKALLRDERYRNVNKYKMTKDSTEANIQFEPMV